MRWTVRASSAGGPSSSMTSSWYAGGWLTDMATDAIGWSWS
jgi:hypothetical protein